MTTTVRSVAPLWLKLAFTAFMAVLVPVYWHHYGATNFLRFCDIALFLTLAGLWLERPLLVSMAAVGILVPQLVWLADFGVALTGGRLLGMTDYMFDADRSLLLRGLSLFHGWLPLMLVYLVHRNGHDRRAFAAWTVLAWAVLLFCYFFTPPPSPDPGLVPVNINCVFGPNEQHPQTWMAPQAWLLLVMTALPLALIWPAHALLGRLRDRAAPVAIATA